MFLNGTSADAVLSTSFRYPDKRLLWARLELFEDRIEFSGVGWRGRHRRTLPLDDVKAVQWRIGRDTANLVLHRHAGAPLPVHVDAAGLWKHKIEARADRLEDVDRPARTRFSPAAAQ